MDSTVLHFVHLRSLAGAKQVRVGVVPVPHIIQKLMDIQVLWTVVVAPVYPKVLCDMWYWDSTHPHVLDVRG